MASSKVELTVDQLAAKVGMTVRNVRAYAARGLVPAPRMVGRTGYYDDTHVARLTLVRDLVDRGYTLNAVEKALDENPNLSHNHALDLLTLLTNPIEPASEPEEMSVKRLTEMARMEHDDEFLDKLAELGLLEVDDEETVTLLRPVLVRAGAQAMALGLSRDRVLELFDAITVSMQDLSRQFVDAFRSDVWTPFTEAGFPDDRLPEISASIQSLLPVVAQATLASFRYELTGVIEETIGEVLHELSGEQVNRLLGTKPDESPQQ